MSLTHLRCLSAPQPRRGLASPAGPGPSPPLAPAAQRTLLPREFGCGCVASSSSSKGTFAERPQAQGQQAADDHVVGCASDRIGLSVADAARARVPALRKALGTLGLDTKGKKAELVARLAEALAPAAAADLAAAPPAAAAPPVSPAPAAARTPSTVAPAAAAAAASLKAPAEPAVAAARGRRAAPSAARSPAANDDAGLETGMAVTWLGTSSGAPSHSRNVSSIALRLPGATYLVDAGEGTFVQLARARINPATVQRIFITHMHGDHCFGLLGILRAVAAAAATSHLPPRPLHVHGPPGVHAEVAAALRGSGLVPQMPLLVHQYTELPAGRTPPPQRINIGAGVALVHQSPDARPDSPRPLNDYAGHGQQPFRANAGMTWSVDAPERPGVRVTAAHLQHRVPCWGYVFEEEEEGREPRKVVLLGDTCNSRAIQGPAAGCDLLSHEATFAAGMEDKAAIAQHSTATMAGEFARSLRARQLVLTHFSARYEGSGGRGDPRGGRGRRGGRGGRGGPRRGRGDDDDDLFGSEEFDKHNVGGLLREARRAFGSDAVVAAYDTFTVRVPRSAGPSQRDGTSRVQASSQPA